MIITERIVLLSAFKQTAMLHSFLSERKWGYYVQMHDNKEREWREHSFLTPTLLHHTPIATLCHPTPSFLPVLFLVYWIFLFFPDPETNLAVLCSEHCFSMILIHINMVTCEPSWCDIALDCAWQEVLRCVYCVFAIQMFQYLKPWDILCLNFTLMSFFGQCSAQHRRSQWADSLGKRKRLHLLWCGVCICPLNGADN